MKNRDYSGPERRDLERVYYARDKVSKLILRMTVGFSLAECRG
jgi:hypothetical protein